jgi:hypothetical protein
MKTGSEADPVDALPEREAIPANGDEGTEVIA